MAKKRKAAKVTRRARPAAASRSLIFGIEKDFVIIGGGGFLVVVLMGIMFLR